MAEIFIPTTGVSGQLVTEVEWSIPDLSPVGTLVYVSGTNQARAADNSDVSTAPARGIIISKTAVAVGKILFAGEAKGFFAGLTPGQDVFLGTGGGVVQSGGLPTAPGSVVQKIGSASAADSILFFPNQLVIL